MPDMRDPEALIDAIAQDLSPVRRVSSPWRRALSWAPPALALGYLATRMFARFFVAQDAGHAALSAATIALSLALGLHALACALAISVAGGRAAGKGWMRAGLGLWLLLAMISISLSPRPFGYGPGVGLYCFTFVMMAGLPMIAVVIAALRQTRSLRPRQSLQSAGMAIAFLAFGLLGFCHPAEMSLADFIMHLLAGLTLGAITLVVGYRAIRA